MKMKTLILLYLLFSGLGLFAQDKNISNGEIFDGEPYLSVNPQNPQHMVVVWLGYQWLQKIIIKTRVTFDAGQSWSEAVALPHVVPGYSAADPSLAFDYQGNIVLVYIDYNKLLGVGAVYSRISTDGGLSWGDAQEVIAMDSDPGKNPIDRPWAGIDRTPGSLQGTVYVTTMNAKGAVGTEFNPYLTRSPDGGQSWGDWRYIDTTGWLAGSIIKQPMPTGDLAADGVFHCAYPSWKLSQYLQPWYFLATLDTLDGSFSYHTLVEATNNVTDTLAKRGALLRCDPIDAQHLIFLHLSKAYGDADVFFTQSFDSGNSWEESVRVNDDSIGNNRMQDLVWADFDTDGDLVVSWRDRRKAADSGYRAAAEIWGAVLWKDSTGFSANFRISDTLVAYDSILDKAGNDFMCVVLRNDTLSAVWGDTRDSSLNIWFKRMVLPGALPVGVSLIASEPLNTVNCFPNPFSNSTTIEYTLRQASPVQITIFNHLGAQVDFIRQKQSPGKQQFVWDAKGLPSGMYYFTVQTGKESMRGKMLVVR
ncbi:MAG: T9SS type A sorting domain-containing protein [Bacteroidales bacterium]|nr:T9SS type A sorting domain-containing protein [Bacteroidales bacterium]